MEVNAVWIGLALAAVLYLLGRRRPLRALGARRPLGRQLAFWAALLTIALALESPLDGWADDLFWAHMVQHVLLIMVAAPLIVLSAPWLELWRQLPLGLRRRLAGGVARKRAAAPIRAAGRTLGRPLPAWIAFNVVVWAWHLPALYDLTLRFPAVHDLEHALFLLTAVVFWAQVAESPPLHPRLGNLGRVVYLTAATISAWLLAVVLALWPTPLYSHYAHLATRPGGISALGDQQLAAGVMWGPGGLPFAVCIFVFLYRWLGPAAPDRRRHRSAIARDALRGA